MPENSKENIIHQSILLRQKCYCVFTSQRKQKCCMYLALLHLVSLSGKAFLFIWELCTTTSTTDPCLCWWLQGLLLIQMSTSIISVTGTHSNYLLEKKCSKQFKCSLNCHCKAGSLLISIVFVRVSLDGLPSSTEERCRFFWDYFFETHCGISWELRGLGMIITSLTHQNSHLKADPLVV